MNPRIPNRFCVLMIAAACAFVASSGVAMADTLTALTEMTDSGEADNAIVSFTFEGTTYVVADGDLLLGTTTRWYIDPATGEETEWVEGDPVPPGVPTVAGTSNPKVGDVGSLADNFLLRAGGANDISSIDGIDFQVTLFPFPTDIVFHFERGGNDNGTWQGINPDGSLRDPVPFLASQDYGDTGVGVPVGASQHAWGVVFRTDEPIIGVRITASGHDTLSISMPAPKPDTLTPLSDMTDSGENDNAIVSFTFEGVTYIVADGDLVLGTTTRWFIDPETGEETLWPEGDPIPPGVPTVDGTGTPKPGDVGSLADNFLLRAGGANDISSIDAIDFQVTLFPFPTDIIFLFERGGNDNGTWQGINPDGSLRPPVPFLASQDYGDTGIGVPVGNSQHAWGVVFRPSSPVIGVRINAPGHDTLSISTVRPPDDVDEVTLETESVVASVDPNDTLTIRVPQACTADGPVDVVLTSDNMASVNPVGSADGSRTVSFAQGTIVRNVNLSYGQAGTATLSVGDGGICATGAASSVTITVHPLEEITVDAPSPAMEVGDVQSVSASGRFGPANLDLNRDITNGVAWSTTDVTGSGVLSNVGNVVTAQSLGDGQVVAASDGITGTANVVVAERVTKIAFIAGSLTLNDADRAAVDHLKTLRFNATTGLLDPNGLPPSVNLFDDNDFNEADLDAEMDLVIASSTISSVNVGGKFRCLSVPMIFWETALHQPNREGLANAGGTSVGHEDGNGNPFERHTDLFIEDIPHPITQGIATDADGFVSVYDEPQTIAYASAGIQAVVPGALATDAVSLAEFDFVDESTITVAETGSRRFDGVFRFLGRRVFLWLTDDSFDNLNAVGLQIFDNAVGWALAGDRLQGEPQMIEVTSRRTSICTPGMGFLESSTVEQLTVTGVGDGCPIDLTASSTGTVYAVIVGGGVVSVDAEGLVTAVSNGSATVRATNGPFIAEISLEVAATPPVSGFNVEYYGPGLNPRAGPLPEAVVQVASRAPDTSVIDEVVNYFDADQGDDNQILGGSQFPGDRPGDENDFVIHAFGQLIFPSTDPVTLRVRSSDGFGLFIDDVLVMSCSCDRGNTHTEVTYTPAAAGALPFELFYWERDVGASLEFTQVIDGQEVLVNDPNDTRALRSVAAGCLEALPQEPPALTAGDTIVTPTDCPTDFTFETNEDVTVGNVVATTSDGSAGPGVTVSSGSLQVSLDAPLTHGVWLRLDVDVTGQTSGVSATLTVFLAYQGLDVNGDGTTNIRDATAFGDVFRGSQDAGLIDFNCDGVVNIRDATAFGDLWRSGFANTTLDEADKP